MEELTFYGYTQQQISDKLNISLSTVRRDQTKMRRSNQYWLEDLAKGGLIHAFREALEGYRHDLARLHDMLEDEKDKALQIRIYKSMSDIRAKYLEILAKTPTIWGLQILTKENNIQPVEMPELFYN